jgi:hypothetical protein
LLEPNKDQLVTELVGKAMLSGFRGNSASTYIEITRRLACPHADRHPIGAETIWTRASTARAKGAIGRLNFHLTLVLRAGGKPECAARNLNSRAARPFVWIIHKLVEPNR